MHALRLAAFIAALAGSASSQQIAVTATDATVPTLNLLGAWELAAPGGAAASFSGIDIDGDRLLAVTDRGYLLTADLVETEAGIRPSNLAVQPIMTGAGPLPNQKKNKKDAEALGRLGDQVFVAFERDHRIVALSPDGALAKAPLVGGSLLKRLEKNHGIEGLAGDPDGSSLIAFGEQKDTAPWWRIAPDGTVLDQGDLALIGDERITGADFGPDGRLYLVRRDGDQKKKGYRTEVVIERFGLTNQAPDAASREELARFRDWRPDGAGERGIGNVEGIAVTERAGTQYIWLVTDNDGEALRRSLLMRFEIID